MNDLPVAQMPRYKCHKEVWALKIKAVEQLPDPVTIDRAYDLIIGDGMFAPIGVSDEWHRKHSPKAGGYYVVYKDGYKSFSPADAFEEGYTRVT